MGQAKQQQGITDEIINAMTECNASLSKGRKKRVVPEGTAAMDDIRSFSLLSAIPLHKTTQVTFCHQRGRMPYILSLMELCHAYSACALPIDECMKTQSALRTPEFGGAIRQLTI